MIETKLGKNMGTLWFQNLKQFKNILATKNMGMSLEKRNGVIKLFPANIINKKTNISPLGYIVIFLPMPRAEAREIFNKMKLKLIVDKI